MLSDLSVGRSQLSRLKRRRPCVPGLPAGARVTREWMTIAPAYLVPGLASIALVPLLFHVLGPDEYGRWVLMYGVAAGVPQLSATWLEASTVRFGHRQRIDPRFTILALAASVALAAFVAGIFVPRIDTIGVVATGIYTATIAGYVLSLARLQAGLRFALLARTAVLRSITTAGLAALGAALGHTATTTVIGSAAGYALGVVIAQIPSFSTDRSGLSKPSPLPTLEADIDPQLLRMSRGFAISSAAMSLAVFILSVGDRFILSMFRPIGEVGLYAATYSIADLAGRLLPSIVLVTLRPRIFRAWDAQHSSWARDRTQDTAVLLGWLGAVVGTVLLAVAFIGLPLPIEPGLVGPISAGLTALFTANALGLLYTAAGRQAALAGQIVATAIASVIANLVLVPLLGARGAAVVTLMTYATQLVLACAGLRRIGLRADRPGLIVSIAALTLVVAATSWWLLPPIVLLALAGVLLVLAPAIVRIVRHLVAAQPDWASRD